MSNAIHRLVSVKGFGTCLFAAVGLFLAPMSTGSVSSGNAEASTAEDVGTPLVTGNTLDYPTWHLPRGATLRLGKGVIGDSDRAIAFSPDGKLLAVASGIGVWLYTVENLESVTLLPSGSVNSLSFSSDGATLASGGHMSGPAEVRLWDVATATNTATFGFESGVSQYLVLSPDGKTFIVPTWRGQLKRLDPATGRLTPALTGIVGDWDGEISISFSPDGKTLASASRDGTVKLWDVATRTKTATLSAHQREVNSVSFSPDGRTLASASRDGTVKLWDVATRTISAPPLDSGWQPQCVAFSPDGATLAYGTYNGSVPIWDARTGRRIDTFDRHGGTVRAIAYSPDGATLATASADGNVFLWDLATGNFTTISGHLGRVSALAVSADGATLASHSAAYDGVVNIWNATTGGRVAALAGHGFGGILSLSFSPDGTTLASASQDRTVRVWDLVTHSAIDTFRHTFQVGSVSFSPDGTTIATGDFEGFVHLWDAKNASKMNRLAGLNSWVTSLLFSPDGETLAAGTINGEIRLSDVVTGSTTRDLEGHSKRVLSMAFSLDETALATASYFGTVKVWDLATGSASATLEEKAKACVAFSPDRTMFATSAQGSLVRLYDMSTGDIIATFEGHNNTVTSVLFTPDGRFLASGSDDGAILMWDLQLIQSRSHLLMEVSGIEQRGPAGTVLAQPFVVSVLDQNGEPYAGATVTFVVTAGGGTLSVTTATTNASGHAATTLTLGSQPGTNTVVATVAGLDPVAFTAIALSNAGLLMEVSGIEQRGPAGTVLAQPFVVSVLDQNGEPSAGATVTFVVTAGGGTLSVTTATTNASGHAATTLTLGSQPGTNTVVATVAGLDPVAFTAIALSNAGLLKEVSGIEQRGPAGTVLAQPFVVSVLDQNGEPYAGATVTFVVTAGGGTLSVTTATTNASGHAATTLTLGSQPGTNTVVATVAGLDPVAFTAIALSITDLLKEVSGIEQKGPAGTVLAQPFVVSVLDQNGEPSAGATVIFVVTAGGGTLSVTTATTDASGHAATTLTLGNQPGTNTVVAIVAGLDPVVFTAIALSNPDLLKEVSGIEQKGPAGTVLAQTFVVSVLDQNGEPYAGATVIFVVTAGGGTLSVTTATTNASGHAATTLTLGSQPGTNTVVAIVAGLDPVVFTAIALSITDFDGNGKVDFGDFVLFAGKFGLNQGDAGYEARYDLDGNDAIGFSDFLIFARHFGRN